LRSEISSLNDQLKSAFKRLASIDAIFRNKFILFLQAFTVYARLINLFGILSLLCNNDNDLDNDVIVVNQFLQPTVLSTDGRAYDRPSVVSVCLSSVT